MSYFLNRLSKKINDKFNSDSIKQLILKYQKILIYFTCSVITAFIEVVVGWFFLSALLQNILISNTVSILFGAISHYFMTLKYAFNSKHSFRSMLIYISSFIMGIILQNAIIYIFYKYLLSNSNEFIRYFISKFASIALPFVVIYKVRDFLYKKFDQRA